MSQPKTGVPPPIGEMMGGEKGAWEERGKGAGRERKGHGKSNALERKATESYGRVQKPSCHHAIFISLVFQLLTVIFVTYPFHDALFILSHWGQGGI